MKKWIETEDGVSWEASSDLYELVSGIAKVKKTPYDAFEERLDYLIELADQLLRSY